MTTRCDVAVIGLGAMGAATLFQLSRRGVRAVGIDRFSPPHAQGSTHGETRITRLAVGEGDAYVPFARRSHELWRELEAETGEDLFTPCGYAMIARPGSKGVHHGSTDFLGRTEAVARRHRIVHEMLDAAALRRRFPALLLAEGEMAYFEPAGGFVRPERCVDVQLRLAEKGGAAVMRDTPVRSVQERSGSGVVVETDRGTVEAAQVVVSAGSWAGKLLGAPYDWTLVPFRQVLHWYPSLDPALHGPDHMPVYIWVHDDLPGAFFYGFPAVPGTGDVKLGIEQYDTSCDPDAVDRFVDPGDGPAVFAGHVAGRIAKVGPAPSRSATCLYTVTPDHGFVVERHPGQNRVVVVSPCSGHGFKHSAALGEAVAQLVADGRSALDLSPFNSHRLTQKAA